MIPSRHHNPDHLRFQRQQRRDTPPLEPSRPVTSLSHDLIDLAGAVLTVAALWAACAWLA